MAKLIHCAGGYGDRPAEPTIGIVEPIQSVVSYRLTIEGRAFIVPTGILEKWKSFVQETHKSGESCFIQFQKTLSKEEKKQVKEVQ